MFCASPAPGRQLVATHRQEKRLLCSLSPLTVAVTTMAETVLAVPATSWYWGPTAAGRPEAGQSPATSSLPPQAWPRGEAAQPAMYRHTRLGRPGLGGRTPPEPCGMGLQPLGAAALAPSCPQSHERRSTAQHVGPAPAQLCCWIVPISCCQFCSNGPRSWSCFLQSGEQTGLTEKDRGSELCNWAKLIPEGGERKEGKERTEFEALRPEQEAKTLGGCGLWGEARLQPLPSACRGSVSSRSGLALPWQSPAGWWSIPRGKSWTRSQNWLFGLHLMLQNCTATAAHWLVFRVHS